MQLVVLETSGEGSKAALAQLQRQHTQHNTYTDTHTRRQPHTPHSPAGLLTMVLYVLLWVVQWWGVVASSGGGLECSGLQAGEKTHTAHRESPPH